jgi:site-specific recombinase XerD
MHAQLDLWSAAAADRSIPSRPRTSRAPTGARVFALHASRAGGDELDALVEQYVQSAHADRTQKAYANDWRLFERWCAQRAAQPLPASSTTLARYLTQLAKDGRKASTIRRARIAIGLAHGRLGLARPDRDERIRALERGIGRTHGTEEQGARPLLVHELDRMVRTLGSSARDDRDRALLLLGFAGAFRSSELVALDVEAITMSADGMRVHVARSKMDQLRRGSTLDIPRADNACLCAVAAMSRWIERLDQPHGPLFRLCRGANVQSIRIAARVVSRVVQRCAARAGLEEQYSSHSLRSGLATSAFANGASDRAIQVHGRWKSRQSLDRYIHASIAPRAHNVVVGLL